MRRHVRETLIQSLWETYKTRCPEALCIEQTLTQAGIPFILDHFAIIDLPSEHSGIPTLKNIFQQLGYTPRGQDYLADKQNDFCWMAAVETDHLLASKAAPQIVVADFRLEEMPEKISRIIKKYTSYLSPFPFSHFDTTSSEQTLVDVLADYFQGRSWPAPTVSEFETVKAFNELLAWVLVCGRRPNHFTLSVHLLEAFNDLASFHELVETKLKLTLNREGGIIKGNSEVGIAQSATQSRLTKIPLQDGEIYLPGDFVEFVWRYPTTNKLNPVLWSDFYTGFIAKQADYVIESLFECR